MTLTRLVLVLALGAGGLARAQEFQVVSEFVGATIDITEQEYYGIFGDIKGFRSAQFREQGPGFQARIQTKKGWTTRLYTAREFYDIGLAIDRTGPMDPLVWAELSGQRVFEETVAELGLIPTGLSMVLHHEGGKYSRGRYRGIVGHHFILEGRRGELRVPLEQIDMLWYREKPEPDLRKDARIFATVALLGVAAGEIWNQVQKTADFDEVWRRRFRGAVMGLGISPFVVQLFRIYRAPVHEKRLPRKTREKIDRYAFLAFK